MNANANNSTTPNDIVVIEARGIGPQVRAVEREALAVEREALAVEREAGGVVPPSAPPTMGDLLVAAQGLLETSERMLADLPHDSPRRAFVESIDHQAKAIAQRIRHEISSQSAPAAPNAPPEADAAGGTKK